jgi:hypothetical protein
MVGLQDVAKVVMGLGLVYWFFWWCVPSWLGFSVYMRNWPRNSEWVAWGIYGMAILGPVMMSNATLLYIAWRTRRAKR